eukprot:443972_1
MANTSEESSSSQITPWSDESNASQSLQDEPESSQESTSYATSSTNPDLLIPRETAPVNRRLIPALKSTDSPTLQTHYSTTKLQEIKQRKTMIIEELKLDDRLQLDWRLTRKSCF